MIRDVNKCCAGQAQAGTEVALEYLQSAHDLDLKDIAHRIGANLQKEGLADNAP